MKLLWSCIALLYSTVSNISSQDPVCMSWPAVQTAMFLAPVWLSQWPIPGILCTSEQRGLGECQHLTAPGGRGRWTAHSRSHWEAAAGGLLIYMFLPMEFWCLVVFPIYKRAGRSWPFLNHVNLQKKKSFAWRYTGSNIQILHVKFMTLFFTINDSL